MLLVNERINSNTIISSVIVETEEVYKMSIGELVGFRN